MVISSGLYNFKSFMLVLTFRMMSQDSVTITVSHSLSFFSYVLREFQTLLIFQLLKKKSACLWSYLYRKACLFDKMFSFPWQQIICTCKSIFYPLFFIKFICRPLGVKQLCHLYHHKSKSTKYFKYDNIKY